MTADDSKLAAAGRNTLGLLFRGLADDWRGWEGERTWASLERDFDLAATHDGLELVALKVRLRSGPDAEGWVATGTIWLDARQLDTVARDAVAFVGDR